ncbi:MAG: GNAT family N-acetyltransferase [Candidatus Aenigmarchaeota archaeon]|nr:GNAT family N-acetyltransferase [Candidatus Aenigmarchaeota archaeon]
MAIRFRRMLKSDIDNVREAAMASWKHTYSEIFADVFIEKFVNENYSQGALESLLPMIRAGEMFFHVATDESRIVGYCHMGKISTWELFRIYIVPQYQSKGIGKKLLCKGEEYLRRKGAKKYFCFVHRKNKNGLMFYLKRGFVHIPEKDKPDEWHMEKKL